MSVAYKIDTENGSIPRHSAFPVYAAAFGAAFCGIAYQLLLASYASFLLGASVLQYSLVLSLMMASMGLGSLFTDKVAHHPAIALVTIESCLAVVAAVALPTLYYCFATDLFPQWVIIGFVGLIGFGLGMEIPLLNRLSPSSDGLSRILFSDYLGGFVGGVLFPLFLVPRLGFFQIAGILSLLNAATGILVLVSRHHEVGSRGRWLLLLSMVAMGVIYLVFCEDIRVWMEMHFFGIQY